MGSITHIMTAIKNMAKTRCSRTEISPSGIQERGNIKTIIGNTKQAVNCK
jgi:hypothetical protein